MQGKNTTPPRRGQSDCAPSPVASPVKSYRVDPEAYEAYIFASNLTSSERIVALSVFFCCGEDRTVVPDLPMAEIARLSGLSERCVRNQLRGLERAGYLLVTREPGHGRANTYRLRAPTPGNKILPIR